MITLQIILSTRPSDHIKVFSDRLGYLNDPYLNPHVTTGVTELEGIGNEVKQDLLIAVRVSIDHLKVLFKLRLDVEDCLNLPSLTYEFHRFKGILD